jgi:hypothetical protein
VIDYQTVKQFEKKEVGVLYLESGKEIFARGTIGNVSENSLVLITNKNWLIISLDSVKKIKIGKDGLNGRE